LRSLSSRVFHEWHGKTARLSDSSAVVNMWESSWCWDWLCMAGYLVVLYVCTIQCHITLPASDGYYGWEFQCPRLTRAMLDQYPVSITGGTKRGRRRRRRHWAPGAARTHRPSTAGNPCLWTILGLRAQGPTRRPGLSAQLDGMASDNMQKQTLSLCPFRGVSCLLFPRNGRDSGLVVALRPTTRLAWGMPILTSQDEWEERLCPRYRDKSSRLPWRNTPCK